MGKQGGDSADKSISATNQGRDAEKTLKSSLLMPQTRNNPGEKTGGRPPPSTRPATINKRGVSWNDPAINLAGPQGSTNDDNKEPPLEEASVAVSSLLAMFGMKTAKPGIVKSSKSETGKLDKVGEEEESIVFSKTDADAGLMQSLDERDPLTPGANTGNTVLAGVPMDQIQHDFKSWSAGSNGSDLPSPRHRLGSSELRTPPRSPPPRPRVASVDASIQRNPLSRSAVQPRAQQNPARHRRENTVEQALFGLTCALSEIKREDQQSFRLPNDYNKSRRELVDTGHSADRLAATADLLMRRLTSTRSIKNPNHTTGLERKESPPGSPKPSLGKNKWAILKANLDRDNLDQYKKSDGDSEDEGDKNGLPDIEEGSQTDSIEETSDENFGATKEDETGSRKKRCFSLFGRRKQKPNPFRHLPYAENIRQEWDLFNQFLKPRKNNMWRRGRYIVLFLWLPLIGISAFLFHFKKFDNPPTGSCNSEGGIYDESNASASWWLLFIVRETVLVCLARMAEVLIIDFLALSTRAILRTCGPMVTLLIVQSKGWPFLMLFWGIFNYALVTGNSRISNHWLFWQDFWGLFNACNPSGNVTSDIWFSRIVAISTIIGAAVSVKRVLISVMLGRTTFANYSQPLAKLMNKMLHISEVATLSREIEKRHWSRESRISKGMAIQPSRRNFSTDGLENLIDSAQYEDIDDNSIFGTPKLEDDDDDEFIDRVIDPDDVDPYTGSLKFSQKARIRELLGRWEEPGKGPTAMGEITIGAVFQFRRALAHMDTEFPFTGSFGLADTRESCVSSSQDVYDRLMLKGHTLSGKLHFDVIASLAVHRNGELDQDKCKDLIRTFRPDREGSISMVDFVRSIDNVYKELRMLRATVASSSKIDQAIEKILNVFFYVFMTCIILSRIGYNPMAMFLSLSSVILAFAFMIGSASAKYFEGILFILIQRPFGIGDRINVSNSESVSNVAGSQGWIVEDVGLYTSTMRLAATNEVATISNGSLAKSRIVNCARSPQAVTTVTLKFAVDTTYKSIEVFKSGVEKFVKARPREWLTILGFRANAVHSDLGHIEYGIVLQHREAWQNIGAILNSRQTINEFCLELAKGLNMRYMCPPLPIELRMSPQQLLSANLTPDSDSADNDAQNFKMSVLTTSDEDNCGYDVRAVAAMFDGK